MRLWWSVYSLERLLEIRTGRPSAIDDPNVSAALPIPVSDDSFPTDHERLYLDENRPDQSQPTGFPDDHSNSPGRFDNSLRPGSSADTAAASVSASPAMLLNLSPSQSSVRIGPFDSISRVAPVPNSATYFIHQIRLSMITHEICKTLYSVPASKLSWADLEKKIGLFQKKLSIWRSDLPNLLNFTRPHRDQVFARERLSLGLHYWSAMVLATRPCLCKDEGRIPNQSQRAKDVDMATTRTCVRAATEIIKFLPDEPNAIGLYSIAPWWRLLHHLVQAASVLMTELSFRAEHMPDEAPQLLINSKKAVRWLWSMAQVNVASGQAWRTMDHLLHRVAPLVGGDTSDMPVINPSATVPAMCETLPYEAAQLYHLGHRSAHDPSFPPAEMGLEIPAGFGLDAFYHPLTFSPDTSEPVDSLPRSFPGSNFVFPTAEDMQNMDIDGGPR